MTSRTLQPAALLGLLSILLLMLAAPLVAAQPAGLTRAQSQLDAGDGEAALQTLAPILRKSPKDADALLARSTAHFLVENLDAGEKDLRRALKLDPSLRQGWLNLGALSLAQGDNQAALTAFQRTRILDPSAPENGLNIGAVHLLLGDLAPAQSEFATYLQAVGDTADANLLVAKNYALANVLDLATRHASKAIDGNERLRLAVRTDPAFSLALDDAAFQAVLARDRFRPDPGSLSVTKVFEIAYDADDPVLAGAVIDALNTLQIRFDPRVEATEAWALVWAESLRIKIAPQGARSAAVTLIAPPRSHSRSGWERLQSDLFQQIAYQIAPKIPVGKQRSRR